MSKISQKFIDRVEDLRHYTKYMIDKVQTCCCPMVQHIFLNYQFEYWYNGYKYNVWEDNVHVYAVNEIPYCYDNETKNTIFYDKLETLVKEDKVWPFLMFVNGHIVPWSQITIIKDYDYSYLRIDGEVDDFSKSAEIIYFPLGSKEIRYGEDEDYSHDPNINGLYFGEDGYLTPSPEFKKLKVRFEFTADIYFRIIRSTDIYIERNGVSVINFDGLEKGKSPTLKNLILFEENGSFIGTAYDYENKYVSRIGTDAFGYFQISDEFKNMNGYILQMYFTNHNNSYSYIYTKDISQDKANDFVFTRFDNSIHDTVRRMILDPFNFSFNKKKSYDKNIREAMKYITSYDYALWNKVFIDESPIKSYSYTGREFKKLSDLRSYVRFSRKHSDLIEDVIMMFVNGEIYKHSIDISYTNNTINIPAFGIMDDDVIELIVFTKCNNSVLEIVVKNEATPVYIHPEYNLEDCYIMDNQSSLLSYPNTPDSPEGRKQYICNILYMEKDKESNYNIRFEDPSHYGRKLKIVPKNQFRYYRYQNVEGQHRIILPQQFNYCHDIDRYMVFVNGCKIDKTEYTVTIPNRYRPFDKLVLYISTILDEEDRVDVFYVPEYLVEKYKSDLTGLNGTIVLSTNYPKLYALSKNTCMVFVNGRKINPLDIKDVDMNKLLVNTKYNVINNVTVIEYINGSKEVAKYLYGNEGEVPIAGDATPFIYRKDLKDICGKILGENGEPVLIGVEDVDLSKYLYDKWTLVMDTMAKYAIDNNMSTEENVDSDVIGLLYEMYPELDPNTITPDYKLDYDVLRSILYDIIVDFYVQRNDVETGAVFDYDFEVEQWNRDTAGNNDITLYPDHDKLLDYLLDVTGVAPTDVLEEKKYLE